MFWLGLHIPPEHDDFVVAEDGSFVEKWCTWDNHVADMLWRNLPCLRQSLLCIQSTVVTNSLCENDLIRAPH